MSALRMSIWDASSCASLALNRHRLGVSYVPVAQHPGELERFALQMPALGAIGVVPGHIEVLEDVERNEGGEARAVRRDFEQLDAGEAGRDRLDPGRGGPGEIIEGQETAAVFQMGYDFLGDLARVETVAARFANAAQSARQRRIAHDLTGLGRPPVDEIMQLHSFIMSNVLDISR